ncbi:MAG: Fe-S cluster assembly protein SufB [Peptoniphilaceae bacterium]|nr:Fe-S cluster assembly protein SufB [Peptoniphilaceae bacterium]MDD7383168.1 Fe-S cluster assembly protein SufB [Peptoniphilaceae bacterium]MDY3738392.1 Fe-S cluster assembly protein SufB [Peptoniphilaceae bacterium]
MGEINLDDFRKMDEGQGFYDFKNHFDKNDAIEHGVNSKVINEISDKKNEPDWMRQRRLKSLEIFEKTPNPTWGPDLSELNIKNITTYVKPKTDKKSNWDALPEEIKDTFDKLGIPKAEQESFAGVGAQYDSEEVYHSIKSYLSDQGVIYTDFDDAVKNHEDIVKKYFQKSIPPTLHKYAALHGALWSGGSLIYVPKGVNVDIPLQSYYRLNAPGAGQFEHTMIIAEEGSYVHFIEGCSAPRYNVINLHAGSVEIFVGKDAHVKFSTIENWSRNMYNLNTKRAIVEENGKVEWVSGSFGSKVSMLYPTSVLKGEGAKSEYTGITFAGSGQYIDNGCSAIHLAANTFSTALTKSITTGTGKSMTRTLVQMGPYSDGSKSTIDCENLMLDESATSDTIPVLDIRNSNVDCGHEAKIGSIDESQIFYLMSRGIEENEARAMIVRGFAEPVSRQLPVEYAVEMNRLIDAELEGANG